MKRRDVYPLLLATLILASSASAIVGGSARTFSAPALPAPVHDTISRGEPQEDGSITGVVTDAVTHAPIAGVWVHANTVTPPHDQVAAALTDGSGVYTLSDLAPGSYVVHTTGTTGYIDEIWENLSCPLYYCDLGAGTPVSVVDGAATPNINFALAAPGEISGLITDTAYAGIANAWVELYDARGWGQGGSAPTDSTGHYSIGGLPAGLYYLRTNNASGYANQSYQNLPASPDPRNGKAVVVTAGAAINIDFTLELGGTITGTITAAVGGAPIGGAGVSAFDANDTWVAGTGVDGSGHYILSVPAGRDYYVRTNNGGGFVDEMYNTVPCPQGSCTPTGGTTVTVAAGGTLPGISFALAVGGSISGKVSDTSTLLGIPGVNVSILNSSGRQVSNASTNESGDYTAAGLPTGTYVARTNNLLGYIDELYNDKVCLNCNVAAGDAISVTQGVDTPGVDFGLARGAQLRGRVTDSTTGSGVEGAWVDLMDAQWRHVSSTNQTGANGTYMSTGLPPGTYYARVNNRSGYVDEVYNNQPAWAGLGSATPIAVVGSSVYPGIDFALDMGATISGRITDAATTLGVANAWVNVRLANGNGVTASARSDATGAYTIRGLAAGTYYLHTDNSSGYANETYNDLPIWTGPASTTPVTVVLGETKTDIDFALAQGATISGHLTDATTHLPITAGGVSFFNSSNQWVAGTGVNSSGYYFVSVPAGTLYARTNNSEGYLDQLYDGLPCASGNCTANTGTAIVVAAGDTRTGLDFALTTGATISGRITDAATSLGVGNAWVELHLANGNGAGNSAWTDATGNYTMRGLAPGTYYLRTNNASGYVNIWYGGLPVWTTTSSTTPVTVAPDEMKTNIDFALVRGATISGRITAAATGLGITNAYVSFYDTSGNWVGHGWVDADGNYTASVPAGTLYAKTTTNGQGYLDQLYDGLPCAFGSCTPGTGTAIVVAVGDTRTGLDFALTTGATISGRITDAATALGVANAWVQVFLANGNHVTSSAWTDATGNYTIRSLAAGTYYLRTHNNSGYANEAYDNLPVWTTTSSTTPVIVAPDETKTNVDFALVQGATVTGHITDAVTGLPIPSAGVSFYNASNQYVGNAGVDSTGYYSVSVPAGLLYARTNNNEGYLDQLYNGLPCAFGNCTATKGTAIVVAVGDTRTGLDFSLATGATISGRITDTVTGLGIANAWVSAHLADGDHVTGSASTDATGNYAIRGMAAGTYYLRTSNNSGYANEAYDDLPLWTTTAITTPVTLAQGETKTNIDFALAQGATITGRVTDAVTGLPITTSTGVSIFNASNQWVGGSGPDSDGYYTVSVPAGTLYARANNNEGYLGQLYSGLPCAFNNCNATAGTAIAVTVGETRTDVNFQLTTGATIRGRITNSATGLGIPNVWLDLNNASGQYVTSSNWSDADGYYSIGGAVPGTYYAYTNSNQPFVNELYNNLASTTPALSGTPISVVGTTDVTGIDFALDPGGQIGGTIIDAVTLQPITNVRVNFLNASGASLAGANTDASGTYVSPGLQAGIYYVRANGNSNNNNYISQLHSGIVCEGSTCPVSITSGTAVPVTVGATATVNFSLAPGGKVSGTVTGPGGVPLANVTVRISNANNSMVTSATTDASGVYTAVGLTTGVHFARTSNGLGYVDQLYSGIPCPGGACTFNTGTPIAVTAPNTTSAIDFSLSLGGSIVGKVYDITSGDAALSGINVRIYNAVNSQLANLTTNASGIYTMAGLPTGTYYARTVNSQGFVDQLYQGIVCAFSNCTPTNGTGIAVTAGSATTFIDFPLDRGGTVTGVVTDGSTVGNPPLQGVSVSLKDAGAAPYGTATTNASGVYTIVGVPAGTYYATTSNSVGLIDERYNNVPCPAAACGSTTGDAIAVTKGATVSGIDFSLDKGGSIAGVVRDGATSNPIQGVTITASDEAGATIATATTDATGVYTVPAIPTGNYRVYTGNSLGYVNELYDNVRFVNVGRPDGSPGLVAVTAPGTASNIDFILEAGSRIAGTVTATTGGAPIQNVTVRLYHAQGWQLANRSTDAGGNYAFSGLIAGTYYVRALTTANSQGYIDESYDNLPVTTLSSILSGTPIVIGSAPVTTTINFSLETGGRIGGTITDAATGLPIPNVAVQVSTPAFNVAQATTDANGVFLAPVSGLPTGTYFIRTANANNQGYVNQVYPGVISLGTNIGVGTPIQVTAPSTTPNINFALTKGGTITGTVTAEGGGPLANARVTVFYPNGFSYFGPFTTNGSGVYTFQGLPTGSYYVKTTNVSGYLDELYNDVACQSCTITTGQLVSVTAGMVTAGIDFTLTPAPVATNDLYANAVDAGATPFRHVVSTLQATSSIGDPTQSCGIGGGGRGVWYSFTAPADGTLRINTIGATYDTVFSVYSGSPGAFSEAACYEDVFSANVGIPVDLHTEELPVTSATTYHVLVEAWFGDGGTLVFNLDFVPGGYVSGKVTAADGTTPLAGINIDFYNSTGASLGTGATTGADGTYVAGPGAAGTYFAMTSNLGGYVDQLYNQALRLPFGNPMQGAPIVVSAGATTSGVNFMLVQGGRISGTVSDAVTSAPLSNVSVRVLDANGNLVAGAFTDTAGAYTTSALPAGTYYAITNTSIGGGYIDQAYNATTTCLGRPGCTTTPTPIAVTVGATTSGVNFALTKGGQIQGTVVDATTGLPVNAVTIVVSDASGNEVTRVSTGTGGGFLTSKGLATGTYFLHTDNAQGYINQLYDGAACLFRCSATAGTPISVTAGSFTAGLHFELARGSRISGSVLEGATLAPMAGIEVLFFDPAGSLIGNAISGEDGTYASNQGFAPATVYARTDGVPGHVMQLHQARSCPSGDCTVTSGDGIAVVDGAPTTGVDFTLAACTAPTLGPATLAAAILGASYAQSLTATGGTAPYGYYLPALTLGSMPVQAFTRSFRLGGGLLPPGLALDSATGQLSGTPLVQGVYSFFVGGVDANGCGGTQVYSLTVGPPPVTVTSLTAESALPGGPGNTDYMDRDRNGWSNAGGVHEFWRYETVSAIWVSVRPYSTLNTYTWTPTAGEVGAYYVQVRVRRAGSTAPFEARLTTGSAMTVAASTPVAIASLAPNVTSPVAAGIPITWTVVASGGTAPLSYEFWRYNTTVAVWTMMQAYSTLDTYTWTPTAGEAGAYYVQARVRSAGSTAAFDARLTTGAAMTVTASTPITISSLAPNQASPAAIGTTTTWTAVATGGTAPLQYEFWRYETVSATWVQMQTYSTLSTYTWTPLAGQTGTYYVQVRVRSAGSTAPFEARRTTGSGFVVVVPAVLSSLTPNVTSPVMTGTPVTWTAVASGGTAPLYYEFWRYDTSVAVWATVQSYSTQNTYTWTPAAGETGAYYVQVRVRSAGSTAPFEARLTTGAAMTVIASTPITISSLTPDRVSPVTIGTTVTWTAVASGGTAPLQYEFWRYETTSATWVRMQTYSTLNTYAWTPLAGQAGTYYVQVRVRSAGSTAPFEARRTTGSGMVVQ